MSKKVAISLILVLLTCAFCMIFISCSEELKSEEIECFRIDKESVKTIYYLGEEFDKSTIKASLLLKDGTIVDISGTNSLEIRGFNNKNIGYQDVTIVYYHEDDKDTVTFKEHILINILKQPSQIDFVEEYDLNKVYDGAYVQLPIVEENFINPFDQEIEINWYIEDVKLRLPPKNVGSYKLEIRAFANDEAEEAIITKDFIISPKELEVNWSSLTYTYDGNMHLPSATVLTNVEGEVINLEIFGEQSQAGVHIAYASMVTANSNYILVNDEKEFTINKKELDTSILTFKDKTVTYDGSEHTIEVVGELPEGFSILYTGNITNVGSSTIVADIIPNNNYSKPKSLEATLTIKPFEVEIEWSEDTFVYDGTIKKPKVLSYTSVNNESVGIIVSEGVINAGENHIIEASLDTSATNYVLKESTKTKTFSIAKADFDTSSLTFEDKTVTYNGNVQTIEVVGDLPDGFSISYIGNITNVGSSTIVANITPNSNYNKPNNLEARLTINPFEIEITWADENFVYDGNEKKPTISSYTSANNELVDITVSEGRINAGDNYSVSASIDTTVINYVLKESTKTKTFSIAKANFDTANLTFEDKAVTYNGNEQTIEVVGDLPDGFSISYTGNITDVGSSTIVANITPNSNYNKPNNLEATLTINPFEVNITWSNNTISYTGEQLKPTATAVDVNGEQLELNVTSNPSPSIEVGVYTATAALVIPNENYTLKNPEYNYNIVEVTA